VQFFSGHRLTCVRLYRDAPLLVIGEGTNEMQRIIIENRALFAAPLITWLFHSVVLPSGVFSLARGDAPPAPSRKE
jgi:hypothetical protein